MDRPTVSLDITQWPIVVLTLRGRLSDADFERVFREVERVLARERPYVFITDAREVGSIPDARQRRAIAAEMRRIRPRADALTLASILVVRSALISGVMSVLTWLSPSRRSRIFVRTMEEAFVRAQRIVGSATTAPPRSKVH